MDIPKKFKKIFITGGAGFIGSHIADVLVKEGRSVTVFDNFSLGKKKFLTNCLNKKNFRLVDGDLLNPIDLERALNSDFDLIFHLASNPDISKGFNNPSLDFEQTIIATFNLMQEMRKKNIKNIVYFSGSGVYGDAKNTFTDEDFGPLFPVSMYGASKLSAESLISAFSNLYSMNAWILRPANIVGDRATHGVIFDFINKLKKKSTHLEILGDGNQSKSYVYISDLIDAVFLTIQKTNKQINVMNIASDSFISVNEIADMVIKAMKLENVIISHTLGSVGWPGDVSVIRLNNMKLKELGWKEKYSSKKAVSQTINDLLI